MREHPLKIITIVLALASVTLALIVVKQRKVISKLENSYTYLAQDEPFIGQAVVFWSARSRESKSDIDRNRYPVVMHIGKETCVELRLYRGSVGGNPIYCFDSSTKQLTKRLDIVD